MWENDHQLRVPYFQNLSDISAGTGLESSKKNNMKPAGNVQPRITPGGVLSLYEPHFIWLSPPKISKKFSYCHQFFISIPYQFHTSLSLQQKVRQLSNHPSWHCIMALYRWWMFKIRFSSYPSIMASTIHQQWTPCPSNHPSCSWETRGLLGFLSWVYGARGHGGLE